MKAAIRAAFTVCDPDWIRTNDHQLRRLMLYPAELPDHRLKRLQIYKNIR